MSSVQVPLGMIFEKKKLSFINYLWRRHVVTIVDTYTVNMSSPKVFSVVNQIAIAKTCHRDNFVLVVYQIAIAMTCRQDNHRILLFIFLIIFLRLCKFTNPGFIIQPCCSIYQMRYNKYLILCKFKTSNSSLILHSKLLLLGN